MKIKFTFLGLILCFANVLAADKQMEKIVMVPIVVNKTKMIYIPEPACPYENQKFTHKDPIELKDEFNIEMKCVKEKNGFVVEMKRLEKFKGPESVQKDIEKNATYSDSHTYKALPYKPSLDQIIVTEYNWGKVYSYTTPTVGSVNYFYLIPTKAKFATVLRSSGLKYQFDHVTYQN